MKKLKHESELFKAALLAGVKYAEGRGAVEFEPTDSASLKLLYVYRLLVHDKVIQPLPEEQVSEAALRHRLAIWYARQLPRSSVIAMSAVGVYAGKSKGSVSKPSGSSMFLPKCWSAKIRCRRRSSHATAALDSLSPCYGAEHENKRTRRWPRTRSWAVGPCRQHRQHSSRRFNFCRTGGACCQHRPVRTVGHPRVGAVGGVGGNLFRRRGEPHPEQRRSVRVYRSCIRPLTGYVAGTLLWFGDVLASGGIAAALADLGASLLPEPFKASAHALIIVGTIGGIALVNIAGVTRGIRLVNATTMLKSRRS